MTEHMTEQTNGNARAASCPSLGETNKFTLLSRAIWGFLVEGTHERMMLVQVCTCFGMLGFQILDRQLAGDAAWTGAVS